MNKKALICLGFLLPVMNVLIPPGFTQGKINGYIMMYYSHDISTHGSFTDGQNNEIVMKRIYFHYDYRISDRFETRFSLEANQKNIGTAKNYDPYVKYAFLKWKNFIPRGDLYIGLSQSPVWANEEKLWAYWSVEKTMFDTRNLGHPVDMGISLKGKFDKSGLFGYHFMIGHGAGHKPETDKYKKFYSSLTFSPTKYLFCELVADYERKNPTAVAKTFKGFIAIKQPGWLIGIETGRRYDEQPSNIVRQGVSFFGRAQIQQNWNILARFDDFNWNKDFSETGDDLWIFGVDYNPNKLVHFIPNIWIKTYKDPDLSADILGKLNVHFAFK